MATQKVRYVSSADGIKVRDTPGGSPIATLNYGNLMYERSTTYQTATLGGVEYTWAYVYYYKNDNAFSEGTGWVAIEFTTVVSSTAPAKTNIVSSSGSIEQFQQLTNARYIYHYLKNNGWRDYPIFAMLGNMESESFINPGSWEELNNTQKGYGLTHWTPSTKLTDWAAENNLNGNDIDTQLKRILYEVENDSVQWVCPDSEPHFTFSAFTTSTKSVYALAEYFIRCYERPGSITSEEIAERQKHAWKWCTLIGYLNA